MQKTYETPAGTVDKRKMKMEKDPFRPNDPEAEMKNELEILKAENMALHKSLEEKASKKAAQTEQQLNQITSDLNKQLEKIKQI